MYLNSAKTAPSIATQHRETHDKWSVVTHLFSLFTLSTMDTCAAGPFKELFLSIICCALDPHQLTLVMSCAR